MASFDRHKKPEEGENSLVTVVMPVFNSEAYLAEAIECVLSQTYNQLELLIINDGSSDASEDIIETYTQRDKRIVYINLDENKGVAYCRNIGLKFANGKYLCWMDSDDSCHHERIEKQVRFLEKNPIIGAVGTQIQRFMKTKVLEATSLNNDPDYIKASLIFRPASVPNATVMLRMDLVREHQLWYNNMLKISEDYDFVSRCSHHFSFSILPEALYNYRVAENSITQTFKTGASKKYNYTKLVFQTQLNKVGIHPTESELLIHDMVCNTKLVSSFADYKAGVQWIKNIEEANDKTGFFEQEQLKNVIKEQHFFLGKKAGPIGLRALIYYSQTAIENGYVNGFGSWCKVAIRTIFKYDSFEFAWSGILKSSHESKHIEND